jgi:hypothetical protein
MEVLPDAGEVDDFIGGVREPKRSADGEKRRAGADMSDGGHSLQFIFGIIFIKIWVLVWFAVQLIIHGQMGRQRELMLSSKICLELMCYRPGVHGNHDYL